MSDRTMNEYEYIDDEDREFDDEDDVYGWSNDEICYECSGYGDDYFVNEEGELECACGTCPLCPWGKEED